MKRNIYLVFVLISTCSFSQTLTDGLMMPKADLCTGFMYTHDRWTDYWQGELKRKNDNIGTVTTQSAMWVGIYGISKKFNALVSLPYVWTKASQGTLRPMEGLQDVSVGVKYNFFTHKFEGSNFKAFGVLNFAMPVTDYTPDYLPLAIGSASTRLTWRLTTYYRLEQGWFANASAGYTWRSNVTLDRPAHWDEDGLVNSTEAFLPNVFDLFVSAGFHKGAIQAELNYMQQNMFGGDDIRSQVMPEVGNRMNYAKAGVLVMYYVPFPKGMAVRGAYSYTVSGRNVGQSTTLTAGLLYTIHFSKTE